MHTPSTLPTVARYLLAGRPRPRIEDAMLIGEVTRMAALARFGWKTDHATGKRLPLAPWQISGRTEGNRPVRDPAHPHAFWLPEDADDDGWIDHVTVYIAGGMCAAIRSRLDQITRIWLPSRRGRAGEGSTGLGGSPKPAEWRLALDGFGHPEDFADSSRLLGTSRSWRSVTPFVAAGHLKKAGHRGEALRLLKRRGIETKGVEIGEVTGDSALRAADFRRVRSRSREWHHDAAGALLEIEFRKEFTGPLALGYGSHFGLGVFGV